MFNICVQFVEIVIHVLYNNYKQAFYLNKCIEASQSCDMLPGYRNAVAILEDLFSNMAKPVKKSSETAKH